MTIEELYSVFLASKGISTDTRTIAEGQLFFALKGENFDADKFALQALEKGASRAVVSSACKEDDARLIKVENTFETLRSLAIHHRSHIRIPVIGLTGTNGKTTTKELIRTALGAAYRVSATEGNLNNDIGVPLTVLRIPSDAEIAIVEMGASHPDDLVPLLEVARPTLGLITNVGKAHLEGFGSFEGVKHAKGLLYDYLKSYGGTVFANAGDPVLEGMLEERGIDAIKYSAAQVKISANPFLRMEFRGGEVLQTKIVGAYNAPNVLAALCLAWYFDVAPDKAMEAISAYISSNNRSQLLKTQKNTVIVDAYNANPSSMAVAVSNLRMMEGKRIALLGDMRELGADSAAEHERVVESLEGLDAMLVGEEFTKAAKGKYLCFNTSDELAAYLAKHPIEGCTVLVKGSRGTRMEKVIPSL